MVCALDMEPDCLGPGWSHCFYRRKECKCPADLGKSPALWSNNRSLVTVVQSYFDMMWHTSTEEKERHMLPVTLWRLFDSWGVWQGKQAVIWYLTLTPCVCELNSKHLTHLENSDFWFISQNDSHSVLLMKIGSSLFSLSTTSLPFLITLSTRFTPKR